VFKDDTLLTLTTHYTVVINANGTGSVTITAAGLALTPTSPTQYAIVGNRTISRSTDFTTGGDFFANTLNDELDQQTIFAQQNAEGVTRALQAPQTDPTTIDMTLPRSSVRAGKVLSFDASGNPSATEFIGSNRGNWATGTLYFVRDIVKDTSTSNIFQVTVEHTSVGAQPLTTNAEAAKYFLLVDAAAAGASATAAAASASAASTSASGASTSATNASNSASTASTQASNASTSATNASNSATAASSSATTASTAATNAGTSATAAATSATNASNSATSASGSASTATTQASNASTSATSAAASASTATTQATNASTSASGASTSASNASTSASNASTSATAAAASAASAAASFDAFDDIYLGAKASDPTVDNDGNALTTGDQYFNTTANELRVYNGSTWQSASTVGGTVTSLNVTGVASFADGSAAAPSITNDGDTNTGIFFPAADTIAFTEGGVESVRINSSGNVGIGTTSGSARLNVNGGTSTSQIRWEVNNAAFTQEVSTNAAANAYVYKSNDASYHVWKLSNTEAMVLNASGNVGIATISPAFKLDVTGTLRSTGEARFDNAINLKTATLNQVYFDDAVAFTRNGTGERMRITSAGLVGIGTSSPSGILDVNGSGSGSGTNWVFLRGGNTGGAAFPGIAAGIAIGTNFSNGSSETNLVWGQSVGSGQFFSISKWTGSAVTEQLRIDSSGNLGIGTSSPYSGAKQDIQIATTTANYGLQVRTFDAGVSDGDTTAKVFRTVNSAGGNWANAQYDAWAHIWTRSGTERARIDSSGNLLVGTTSVANSSKVTFGFTPSTQNGLSINDTQATEVSVGYINFSRSGTSKGSITYNNTSGLTSYNTTSDYRAKDISGPITGSGALIDSIPVYMGKMKWATQERPMFIAHEVPAYAHTGEKDAVDKDDKPVYQQMDASALIPVMWAEIQSLRQRLAAAGI
jgi:hypothetical protein